MDPSMIAEGVKLILRGLGCDPSDPHLLRTPERVAKAWVYELASGMDSPPPEVTMFPTVGDSQMIILHDIPVRSVCAHHLLPFLGTAVVGYIPGRKEVCGVSKLSRVVDYFARRPQVQENLTNQIADFLFEKVRRFGADVRGPDEPGGVGVFIRANHMCMELRGVEHSGNMTTSAIRGSFNEAEIRAEFMSLALRK